MGRTFFPTYSLNRFGVRVTNQRATLGEVQRFPAEPTPRAAMTPTRPILGAVAPIFPDIAFPGPMPVWGGYPRPVGPIFYQGPTNSAAPPAPANPPTVPPPVSASGGGGAIGPPVLVTSSPTEGIAPPVSAQATPTPTVATPPPTQIVPVVISSGGGTTTPSTPTVTAPAPSSGLVDGIAAWLSGTTTIFNYNVPNAILAGIVVLGFALLSSSGKKR